MKKHCDVCGNKFDIWEQVNSFGIHNKPGYGSRYDTYKIDICLCTDCYDRMIDAFLKNVKDRIKCIEGCDVID